MKKKIEIIKTIDGWQAFADGESINNTYDSQDKAYHAAADHFFYRGYKITETEEEYDFSHFFIGA